MIEEFKRRKQELVPPHIGTNKLHEVGQLYQFPTQKVSIEGAPRMYVLVIF
jgi:hypothetical protein